MKSRRPTKEEISDAQKRGWDGIDEVFELGNKGANADYQKAYDTIKLMANQLGLNDEEIERIITNLSTPTSFDMKNSIEKAIEQIKNKS